MTHDNPLANIISTKLIEKISSGIITEHEAQDLNSKLLSNYLNISKDTADRLKRSTQIYNFWKETLQNVHHKSDISNFTKSINTIIKAVPTSMLGQFTMLYNNSNESQNYKNDLGTSNLLKIETPLQHLLKSESIKKAIRSVKKTKINIVNKEGIGAHEIIDPILNKSKNAI